VIPGRNEQRVAGLPTSGLSPGDPYYADGSYNGSWTGEAVISRSAADALSDGRTIDPGTSLTVADTDTEGFVVARVVEASGPGIGQLPVILVHLSELQDLTGGAQGDVADQILIAADDSVTAEDLGGIYPNVQVLSRGELLSSRAASSGLPLAMAAAALIVAVVVGTLFLVTTVGFSVLADAESRAVLAAIGFSARSRSILVVSETLVTAVSGGVIGVAIWAVATGMVRGVEFLELSLPFTVRPVFGLYGLLVAVGIGLVALPPLIVVSRRSREVKEALR
jgi:putative ABC transport system permease protein